MTQKVAASKAVKADKPAKGGKGKEVKAKKEVKKGPSPLFPAAARNHRVGGAIRPKGRDLTRFVKWPRYIRLQRQKKILLQRLKVPPAIHQFARTLDKNQASEVFKLLRKYQPETAAQKKERLQQAAKAKAEGVTGKVGPAPVVIKSGLKHVTHLIEEKKAKLVLIAHDVNPIELVVWLPALCRKMNVPFAIVKSKDRLGHLVHRKTTSVVALTAVHKEDEAKLATLRDNFTEQFNNNVERKWGGGIMGLKTQAKLELRRKAVEAEAAKKLRK